MKEEIEGYLKKAEHALEVAKELLSAGYAPDAASKVYYAMFYAAQALLKSEGIHVVKHSAVESAFGYSFCKAWPNRSEISQDAHQRQKDQRQWITIWKRRWSSRLHHSSLRKGGLSWMPSRSS